MNISSKIDRKIRKLLTEHSRNPRPSSYPYISGDGFRSLADHIYDDLEKCGPKEIEDGETVFLKTDLLEEWFSKIHPQIISRYKLITHNSDRSVGETETEFIDDKIIRWFAQNVIVDHPRITPIPIGIENKRLFMWGWVFSKVANKLKSADTPKKERILFGFSTATNTRERQSALNSLRECGIADEIKRGLDAKGYFELLNEYKFVASPKGNGPDCHRTWEALYLGTIPITTSSVGLEYFKSLGLPIMIVDDYNGLDKVLYNIEKRDFKALNMDYWINLIKNEH